MPKTVYHAQSPDSLEEIAKELETFVDVVRSAKTQMEVYGIETMNVGALKSLEDGMDRFEGFTTAVRRAIKKARFARGDFQADEQAIKSALETLAYGAEKATLKPLETEAPKKKAAKKKSTKK